LTGWKLAIVILDEPNAAQINCNPMQIAPSSSHFLECSDTPRAHCLSQYWELPGAGRSHLRNREQSFLMQPVPDPKPTCSSLSRQATRSDATGCRAMFAASMTWWLDSGPLVTPAARQPCRGIPFIGTFSFTLLQSSATGGQNVTLMCCTEAQKRHFQSHLPALLGDRKDCCE
jgi:hypothetical protein